MMNMNLKASFTIEAAVVIPIIMMIMVAMINLTFDINNKVSDNSARFIEDVDKEIEKMDSRRTLLLYKSICDGVADLIGDTH